MCLNAAHFPDLSCSTTPVTPCLPSLTLFLYVTHKKKLCLLFFLGHFLSVFYVLHVFHVYPVIHVCLVFLVTHVFFFTYLSSLYHLSFMSLMLMSSLTFPVKCLPCLSCNGCLPFLHPHITLTNILYFY